MTMRVRRQGQVLTAVGRRREVEDVQYRLSKMPDADADAVLRAGRAKYTST